MLRKAASGAAAEVSTGLASTSAGEPERRHALTLATTEECLAAVTRL
jgi:hypothetical protein